MKKDNEINELLKTAEITKNELELLENPENKSKIVDALKNSFIADRLNTNLKQEKLRESILNSLLDKIANEKVPIMTLLKLLELTNKGGEMDLTTIVGGGKGGANIQINNNPNNITTNAEQAVVNQTTGPSLKEMGFVLEGIKTIAANIPVDKTLELRNIIKDED